MPLYIYSLAAPTRESYIYLLYCPLLGRWWSCPRASLMLLSDDGGLILVILAYLISVVCAKSSPSLRTTIDSR